MKSNRKTIYLAGGFRSGWQAKAKEVLLGFELLDPSLHNLDDPKEYTEWDLNAVRCSDIVLANMESTNPGGYALALEVGYAKALSKYIVLVDQIEDPKIDRYFEMVRQVSDIVFNDLNSAFLYISTKCS